MCGIAGFSLSPKERLDARALSTALLTEIQSRGRDATGAAWTDRAAKKVRVSKAPIPAYAFTASRLARMEADTLTAVLHTRFATKGTPKNNGNNHPIMSPPIVGVHNGIITNDDDLFTVIERDRKAQVDSEAAFALLAESEDDPTYTLGDLQGRVALAWLDTRNADRLHLARVEGSPLAVAQTKRGSLVFASTGHLLTAALKRCGMTAHWMDEVDEYTYLNAQFGRLDEYLPVFTPAESLTA